MFIKMLNWDTRRLHFRLSSVDLCSVLMNDLMFLPIMLSVPGVCSGVLPSGRVWAQYEGQTASAHSALRPLPVQQPQPVMWPGHGRMSGEKYTQISDNKHRSSCLRCWYHCVFRDASTTPQESTATSAPQGIMGRFRAPSATARCAPVRCGVRGEVTWHCPGHMVTCSSSGN